MGFHMLKALLLTWWWYLSPVPKWRLSGMVDLLKYYVNGTRVIEPYVNLGLTVRSVGIVMKRRIQFAPSREERLCMLELADLY
jgi:hypothetical protein